MRTEPLARTGFAVVAALLLAGCPSISIPGNPDPDREPHGPALGLQAGFTNGLDHRVHVKLFIDDANRFRSWNVGPGDSEGLKVTDSNRDVECVVMTVFDFPEGEGIQAEIGQERVCEGEHYVLGRGVLPHPGEAALRDTCRQWGGRDRKMSLSELSEQAVSAIETLVLLPHDDLERMRPYAEFARAAIDAAKAGEPAPTSIQGSQGQITVDDAQESQMWFDFAADSTCGRLIG